MARKNGEAQMKSEVTTTAPAGLPAELLDQYETDAGQGVSSSADDTMIPLMVMVQKGSPQVDRTHPRFQEARIEGIEAGDLFIASTRTFWKGESGILFVPVYFEHSFNRWRPREGGGGFMGSYQELPREAREAHDPEKPGRRYHVMPDDSEIIEVRNHYGIIVNGPDALPQPVGGPLQGVITLSSTGHTFSRMWMTQINQIRLPSGKPAPSRARQWRISNVIKSNAEGSWFGYKAEDAGWVTDPTLYAAGTAMFQAIQEGKIRAATPTTENGDGAEERGGDEEAF